MDLTWLLLILAVALLALGALRFDVLLARWRQFFGTPPTPPRPPAGSTPVPDHPGAHPHEAPPRKPGFHRSGRRH
ncbi:MAG: hypothetical protein QM788_06100 [Roseateles sp.]|uniref:hypothetical protein n=1 Tax=Roseateles sp. TaxID=1971397 RepID=UPI0039E83758